MTIGKLLEKMTTSRTDFDARLTSRSFIAADYQRRAAYRHHAAEPGLDPTRFGDWEYNGRCTDF
jgi:hypothetical protein